MGGALPWLALGHHWHLLLFCRSFQAGLLGQLSGAGGSQGLHMPLSDLGFHRVERRGGGLGEHDTRGPISSKLSSL